MGILAARALSCSASNACCSCALSSPLLVLPLSVPLRFCLNHSFLASFMASCITDSPMMGLARRLTSHTLLVSVPSFQATLIFFIMALSAACGTATSAPAPFPVCRTALRPRAIAKGPGHWRSHCRWNTLSRPCACHYQGRDF